MRGVVKVAIFGDLTGVGEVEQAILAGQVCAASYD